MGAESRHSDSSVSSSDVAQLGVQYDWVNAQRHLCSL